MGVNPAAEQYARVLDDLKHRITLHGKWIGVPALLDDLHSLRCQVTTPSRAPHGRTAPTLGSFDPAQAREAGDSPTTAWTWLGM
jgi:hypothetical protein